MIILDQTGHGGIKKFENECVCKLNASSITVEYTEVPGEYFSTFGRVEKIKLEQSEKIITITYITNDGSEVTHKVEFIGQNIANGIRSAKVIKSQVFYRFKSIELIGFDAVDING